MIDEKKVVFVLLFLLFLSIAIHSLSGGWSMLWNALQYLLVAGVFFAVLKYKVLLRPILGDQYIDGKYVGQSATPDNKDNQTIEEFTISQTLLATEISGKSKKDGALLATWHGKLIDTRPKIYRFLLEVSIGGTETLGVLTLRIEDGAAEGFYQSLEAPHAKHQAVFTAILKEVYETRQSQWWIMEKLQKIGNNNESQKSAESNVQSTLPSPETKAIVADPPKTEAPKMEAPKENELAEVKENNKKKGA